MAGVTNALQTLVSELQLARYKQQMKLEWVQLAQVFDRLAALAFTISAFGILGYNHAT